MGITIAMTIASAKYLPVSRLDGEDAWQTADANSVRQHTVQAAQQSGETGTDHRAQHREAVFQVDPVHGRFSDPEIGAEIAAGTEISRSLCLRLEMMIPTTAEA